MKKTAAILLIASPFLIAPAHAENAVAALCSYTSKTVDGITSDDHQKFIIIAKSGGVGSIRFDTSDHFVPAQLSVNGHTLIAIEKTENGNFFEFAYDLDTKKGIAKTTFADGRVISGIVECEFKDVSTPKAPSQEGTTPKNGA